MIAASTVVLAESTKIRTTAHDVFPKGATLVGSLMALGRSIFNRKLATRVIAVLACTTLFYLVAGGSLLHHHSSGLENACHVCQSLHMPALAAASYDLVAAPEFIARYSSPAPNFALTDSVSSHRASRAPPSA